MTSNSHRSPVAIVGFSFRLPGADRESLWESLMTGRDLVTSVAPDRWTQDSLLHPNKSEPGTSYTFAAGSIGDVAGFDAAFFGISPREAEQMDPQQRVLLEMAWEAFEHSGIPPTSMRGRRCGVYVGLSSVDYAYRRADDLSAIDSTTMTGNAGSIAANRLSYVFDLRGPSMVIDTACSSSLVAFHQACQSIRSGETEAALVGGISLHLHPYGFIGFSKASMLSRHGRCGVFDAEADGYVRAEGGGIVILKPLVQALADGNRILAVVAGTGVNSDGRKSGLTVPSHTAQAALLRDVYRGAGIAPADIDYYEAHGTGTAVGDPLETRAIGEALGQGRPSTRPLPIGSVKGNVGHLEAAAGMAGLIKVLHVLRERVVPANIHLRTVNPAIDLSAWNLAPVTAALTLPADRRLVVGVSSFGFGGTNAHAVLTSFEAPVEFKVERGPAAQANPPLLLSARSAEALRQSAAAMAAHVRLREDLALGDILYSAARHRDIHPHRLAACAADRAELVLALERFAAGGTADGVVVGKYRPDASAPAFVYSGNGSQWLGMGLALLDEEPVFREAVEAVDALYSRRCGESILGELRASAEANRFAWTEVAQPVLFALQVGLTRLLEHRGVIPMAVCGHSVGEVAAAWASGALTLDQAVRVIHQRSAHQARTRGEGCMTAVAIPRAAAETLIEHLPLGAELGIAAVNSAHHVTIAGTAPAVASFEAALTQRGVVYQRLALDYAFHSVAMDPIRDDLIAALQGLKPRSTRIPMYSTVTGAGVGSTTEGGDLGPRYWWDNVRQPVNFAAAIGAMVAAGVSTFVEIGPRAVLTTYLADLIKPLGNAGAVLASLTRRDSGAARLRGLTAELEVSGALRGAPPAAHELGRHVDLPYYPWQRERYWHPTTADAQGRLTRAVLHPLLGYALAGDALHWENQLDVAKLPAYADHVVGGAAVFPAAGFVEMALAAGRARRRVESRSETAPQVIEDLEIVAPLLLDVERSCTVRLHITGGDGRFSICSRERGAADPWRTHVTGRLVEECVVTSRAPVDLPLRVEDAGADAHYALARSLGLDYGPAFRTVAAVWFCREGVLGALSTPPSIAADLSSAMLHPAYLDGAFQLLADLGLREPRPAAGEGLSFLPVRIERLELLTPHARVTSALATPAQRRSSRSLRADFTLFDATGAAIAVAHGVRFRAVSLQGTAAPRARWLATRAVPLPRRDSRRAVALPASEILAQHCAARLHAPTRRAARERFSLEVEPLLDALCGAFAARALRELSGDQPVDRAALVECGRVAASSAPLLERLVDMLAEEGLVQRIGTLALWRTDVLHPGHEDIWSSLIADYPEYAPLTARVGAVGLHLAERLRDGPSADGRAPRDSPAAWTDGCTQQEAADVAQGLLDVIRGALAAQPAAVRLRVLRIVGSAPPEGLPLLPEVDADRCELVIGAASQMILDDVRSRWSAAATLACHVVDLEGAGTHDAALGAFDIVVLGDGLTMNSGADLQLRLVNLRSLLFDDGRLIVLEQQSSRAADLLYGLDPSWWDDARADAVHPRLRIPGDWSETLARANFDQLEVVHDLPAAPSGPYVLIARAGVRPCPLSTAEADCRTWLVLGDGVGYSAELGAALSDRLAARGQRVVTLACAAAYGRVDALHYALDPQTAAHWDRLFADLHESDLVPQSGVHLAGLDLSLAGASVAARAAGQELRAQVLVAWLQACARHDLHPDVWVVAAQAGTALLPAAVRAGVSAMPPADALRDAALWGIARVAMQECSDQRVRWVDLIEPLPCAVNAANLAQEMLYPDAEDEILLTATGRYGVRMAPREATPAMQTASGAAEPLPRVQLDCSLPGSFRNLAWRSDADLEPLADDAVEIEVQAAGLNFRDVMYAMGLLPDDAVEDGFCGPSLGMEVAGTVTRVGPAVTEFAARDAVIAFAPASFANRVRTRSLAVARKPAAWSFAAAATVPTAFFTAYYALHELARLREGERVLIHGGAGGVGIAAIQLAKYLGAVIFATAGTPEKRDFLRLLGATEVFDSRSLAFGDEVLAATGGQGVDVVLNSLAGDAIGRNLRLLRPFGRMLELGKRDFYENSQVGLRPFRNNIAYFGIDADQLLAQRPDTARRVFVDLMALFADGTLTPLPHRTFDATDIASAFRHMQASRHLGKIVVTFPPGFAPRAPAIAPPPLAIRADATYLVSGGLSGFGLATARWLVRQGARHLALLSRRGAAATPEAAAPLLEFAEAGVAIAAPACDLSDPGQVRAAMQFIEHALPPLAGVVHAAMVIEDALLQDLEAGQLHRVLAPKVLGALNLHDATRAIPLDFFVLYSSATTLFGNPGQAAYVAANLALEALADERRGLGLPATCIGWGPIGDAGYLARHERLLGALLGRMGGHALHADEALTALGTVLGAATPNLGFLDLDWATLKRSLPASSAPKYAELERTLAAGEHAAHAGESAQELRRWLGALPADEALRELTALVRTAVADILRIAPERIETGTSLIDLGMDSLMAVELATSIEQRLEVRLSALALSGGPTIDYIVERLMRLLEPGAAATAPRPDAALAAQVYLAASQHAGELTADTAADMVDDLQTGRATARSLTRAAHG